MSTGTQLLTACIFSFEVESRSELQPETVVPSSALSVSPTDTVLTTIEPSTDQVSITSEIDVLKKHSFSDPL